MLESYRELLDLIAQTPTRLRIAAEAAKDAPEGEWSAAQVLAHLAASERLWLGRLNAILYEPDTLIRRGPSPEVSDYQQQLMSGNVTSNLAEFNRYRGETVSILMGLSLRGWEKTGTHETRGELSVADVVEGVVDHDAEHLQQIEALG